MNDKIIEKLEMGFKMSVDATFGVFPFRDEFTQLMVAMGNVNGRVSSTIEKKFNLMQYELKNFFRCCRLHMF